MNEIAVSPAASVPRTDADAQSLGRRMLNKVPEVTIYFWIIKILCTTVGETAADLMNEELGLGLTNTTYIMGAALIAILVVQFRSRKYVPWVYWLAVVLISIVGTLITDNLVDNAGVPLETTTIAFSAALAVVFAVWYAVERTLSVHTIVTSRREAFYWLAILFTFALGTSAGDLFAEKMELGYLPSLGIFAGAIAVIAVAHFRFKLNAILAFWLAYILTRPLGASIGDFLSQPVEETGLGLGTVLTSLIFLSAILALVVYLSVTKRDLIAVSATEAQLAAGAGGLPASGRRRLEHPRRRQQAGGDAVAGRCREGAGRGRSGEVRDAGAEPGQPPFRPQQHRHNRRQAGPRTGAAAAQGEVGGGGRRPSREQPQCL